MLDWSWFSGSEEWKGEIFVPCLLFYSLTMLFNLHTFLSSRCYCLYFTIQKTEAQWSKIAEGHQSLYFSSHPFFHGLPPLLHSVMVVSLFFLKHLCYFLCSEISVPRCNIVTSLSSFRSLVTCQCWKVFPDDSIFFKKILFHMPFLVRCIIISGIIQKENHCQLTNDMTVL